MQLSKLLTLACILNSCASAVGNWSSNRFNISVSGSEEYITCAARSVSSAKLRYDESTLSIFSDYGDEFAIMRGKLVDLSQVGPNNYVEVINDYQETFTLTGLNSTNSTWAIDDHGLITFNGKSDFYMEPLPHYSCELAAVSTWEMGVPVNLTVMDC